MHFRPLLLLFVLALAGCASVDTQKEPAADLRRIKTAFVVSRLGDDHHIDEIIAQQLNAMGIQATVGAYTMRPDRVDALITYTDRWEWDFKSYLIEFHLNVRDGITEKLLATVNYYRPSVVSKTPTQVVRELLPPLFKLGPAPVRPASPAAKPRAPKADKDDDSGRDSNRRPR